MFLCFEIHLTAPGWMSVLFTLPSVRGDELSDSGFVSMIDDHQLDSWRFVPDDFFDSPDLVWGDRSDVNDYQIDDSLSDVVNDRIGGVSHAGQQELFHFWSKERCKGRESFSEDDHSFFVAGWGVFFCRLCLMSQKIKCAYAHGRPPPVFSFGYRDH